MKHSFVTLCIALSVSLCGFCQPAHETEATIDDLTVKPIRIPSLQEISGSPFLTQEYRNGNIHLSGNRFVPDMPVRFNILSNALMVQRDGQELKLEAFTTVDYQEPGENGTVKVVQFAMGFPEIDKHNDKSVYLVLSSGPHAVLLKYISQKVEDVNTLGDYSRKELVTTEQLYIYVPGKEIRRVKSAKKDISEALPQLAGRIDEIASSHNLRLKSEDEIVELLEELNKP